MKLFIFYIVAILCTSIGCESLRGQEKNPNSIVRMDIVSLNFRVSTRIAITFDHLLEWTEKDGAFRAIFTEKNFLDSVDERLQQLQMVTFDASHENHRIACIVVRQNGQIDKLGITGLNIVLNGKSYQWDNSLLLLIANRLPEDQRKVIYRYVSKKEEIQRQKEAGTYKEEVEDWEEEQGE
jgi:hypothetical protein